MGWTPLNFHPCEYTVSQALYSRMLLRFWRLKAVQWGLLLSFAANLDSLHKAHWDRASECCGMESHPVWPQSSSCGDCMGQGECSVGGMACIQLIHLCAEVAYWQSPKLASCQGNIRELHILCRAVPEVHKKKKKKHTVASALADCSQTEVAVSAASQSFRKAPFWWQVFLHSPLQR